MKREARLGVTGTYFVIVYDMSAQHFILDNLDAITDFQNSTKETQGKPWMAEQDACLTEPYEKGVSVREIAAVLKRNGSGIRARLKKRGLIQQ